MVDIQSATAEIRRGKKERRTNYRAKIITACPILFHRAAIMTNSIVNAYAGLGC